MSQIFTILFISFFSLGNIQAKELVFVNDMAPYCPYTNCGNKKSGFVIDTVRAIFESRGYKVKIINVPWNRALLMVNGGKADGILGLLKGSAPGLIYPKTEVAKYEVSLFTLKGNPWKYNGVASLKNIRMGLMQGYDYEDIDQEFKKFLKDPTNKPNFYWATSLERSLLMIERKRLDAILEVRNVIEYIINKEKLSEKIKYSGTVGDHDVLGYVGFSRHNSESQKFADIFDEGMIKLRKTQQFKGILNQYNVKDWK